LPIISKWKSFAKPVVVKIIRLVAATVLSRKKNSRYGTNKMRLADLLQGCIKKQNNYENKTEHHTTPFG